MEVPNDSCKTSSRSSSKVKLQNHSHSCEIHQQEIRCLKEENDALKAKGAQLDHILQLLAEKRK